MRTKNGQNLKILYDKDGRLICLPYSLDNLHEMAGELGLKKCWFEKGNYLIPHFREEEIKRKGSEVESGIIDQCLNK